MTSAPANPQCEYKLLDLMFDHEKYKWLRDQQPVARVRHFDGTPAWLISRYEDAMSVLADPRVSTNPRHHASVKTTTAPGIPADYLRYMGRSLSMMDAPHHTRVRRLVSQKFTARRVQQLRPRIEELAAGLLDELGPRGEVDLLTEFAYPLPFAVISELLGMPASFREPWRRALEGMMWGGRDEMADGAEAMVGYATRLVRLRRDQPGDDLISALVRSGEDGDQLDEDELISMVITILNAGHETTAQLIANGTFALLTHPDQLALLRNDPSLLPGAVEEMLRYWGPAEIAAPRFTTGPVDIAGVTVPAGEVIQILWGATHRDECTFSAPDRFDVTRRENPHLGFGHGAHFCLGAALARAEGEVVFTALLRRFPGLALAVPAEAVRWKRGFPRGINRLESLPVHLGVPA